VINIDFHAGTLLSSWFISNLKQILMQMSHLIQQQPLRSKIVKDPPDRFLQKRQIPVGYTPSSKTLR